MAKRFQLPINEFIDLTSNKRGLEIADAMDLLRNLFPIDEDWIYATLNRIPQNQQEILYVTFLIGAIMIKPLKVKNAEFLIN